MKFKKLAALFMSVVMCAALMAGCGNNAAKTPETKAPETQVQETAAPETEAPETAAPETEADVDMSDPLVKMVNGRYMYSYMVGDMEMTYFFHFYEERPVIGKVFYAGFAMNQITFAGTYTVEEKEYTYSCWEDRAELEAAGEGAAVPTGTAPYTITFFDFNGNELDQCGFDGDILYHDMDVVNGIGGDFAKYRFDGDIEGKYKETYDAEVGINYISLVAEDPTSTLRLFHSGRYEDMVGMMVEGSWEMVESAEGLEFVLTPDSESDTPAVVVVSADKSTATYTPEGGEPVAMTNADTGALVAVHTMVGQIPVTEDAMADVILSMYGDGTCTIVAAAFGQEMPLDAGTYEQAGDGYTFTFVFDNGGEYTSELAESGLPAIQYQQAGTQLGDLDVTITYVLPE